MMQKLALFLVLLFLFLAFNSFSQTITLETPNFPNSPIKEGNDFFTTIMNNPLDFNERRDFLFEKNFEENTIRAKTQNGVWSGDVEEDMELKTTVWPLFQGLEGAVNSGLTGANYPLDASKFNLYSSFDIISQRHRKVIMWTNDGSQPELSKSTDLIIDGYENGNSLILHDNNKPVIDVIDLSSFTTWENTIRGVRLDPIHTAKAGSNVTYDWIRISDPNSAEKITFQGDVTFVEQIAVPHVHIYVDTDASGHDGILIKRLPVIKSSDTEGSYDYKFPTAALPPGEYYFYVELRKNADNPDPVLATPTGYTPKLKITGKPKVTITNPTYTSGADYATEVLGNPWDMSDEADIINENAPIANSQIKDPSFMGGIFCATSVDLQPDPFKFSDSKLFFNVDPDNPIATNKYRYLTYDWEIDETNYFNKSISFKLGYEGGWATRLSWADENFATDGSTAKIFINYEGKRSYSLDLQKEGILDFGGGNIPANLGWLGNKLVRIFRLDPLENTVDTKFFLDDVKLTAVPEFKNNLYTIEFTTEDIDEGDGGTVEFFYDIDNHGFNGVSLGSAISIGTFGDTPSYTYEINNSTLPDAEVFIYAKITDNSGNINYGYSDVPISNISSFCGNEDPLVVSTPTDNNIYRGVNVISDGTVNENECVYFSAENTITLNSGFCVKGEFLAKLKNCNTSFTAAPSSSSRGTEIDDNREFNLKVFPNPFSGSTTIEYNLPNDTEVSIRVYNMSGQESQILMNNKQLTAGVHQVIFEPINTAENGMYMIVFQDDTHYKVEKVFYQK